MAIRKIIFFCVIGLLAVLAAAQIWPARAFFMINKAHYLMNQAKWDKARGILKSVLAIQPGNDEACHLLAWADMHLGDYEGARNLLETLDASPDKEYGIALASYQLDLTSSAVLHFRGAVSREGGRLTSSRKQLAAMAAGELSESMSSELLSSSNAGLQPLDEMLKNSIEGRILFRRSEFTEAEPRLARALEMGDRTSDTLLLACAANAALGNYPRAKWYADHSPNILAFYPALAEKLTHASDRFTSRTFSTYMAARFAELRRHMVEARLWARLRGAEQAGTTEALEQTLDETERLVAAKPASLTPGILLAESLEATGRYRDAYLQYESLYNRQPCYALLLRMRDLAGDIPEIKAARAAFIMDVPSAIHVSAGEMNSTSGLLRRDHMALFNSGSVTVMVEIPVQGYYRINVIARGDRAEGLNPLMKITVDDQTPEHIYVAREGWDCYAVTRYLGQGTHRVEMEFLNDNRNRAANDDDRNLYLGGLIVSRTGVY
ncbi:MAG: tetratricopeptide repeat protein [Candidatus Sumerlaeota bacterium]|nr:tetratricopeptide repeat protein [Candidatus Sumerlaeota bacterium]